jgi:hypothetical protein
MSSWSYRGTTLDSLGIVTLVSDSFRMPERRGKNILIPLRDGREFVEKMFEQRSMSLGLEVDAESIEALEAAIDVVKTLFGKRTLGTLQQTLESGAVRKAQAELEGDLSPSRISPNDVRMLLEFTMPNPFFYSDTLTTDTQTINASPKTYTLNNPGTVGKADPKIVLTGPLSSPEITNVTNGVKVKYNAAITAGHYVTIDVDAVTGEYTAVDDLAVNVIGNVSHEGDTAFFVLDSGDNSISVTDGTATTGTVKIEFYAPFL